MLLFSIDNRINQSYVKAHVLLISFIRCFFPLNNVFVMFFESITFNNLYMKADMPLISIDKNESIIYKGTHV